MSKRNDLISAACEAEERLGVDECERYAEEQRRAALVICDRPHATFDEAKACRSRLHGWVRGVQLPWKGSNY